MSIFGAGGGVSIHEGSEGASWWISLRSFRSVRHGRQFWEAIERSKDPTTFVIVVAFVLGRETWRGGGVCGAPIRAQGVVVIPGVDVSDVARGPRACL